MLPIIRLLKKKKNLSINKKPALHTLILIMCVGLRIPLQFLRKFGLNWGCATLYRIKTLQLFMRKSMYTNYLFWRGPWGWETVLEIKRGNGVNIWNRSPQGLLSSVFFFPQSGPWRASLIAQLVKNPPAMQEVWVQFLIWEDPLEKGKATHSSILAWRIPWTRGRKELDMTEQLSLLTECGLYHLFTEVKYYNIISVLGIQCNNLILVHTTQWS